MDDDKTYVVTDTSGKAIGRKFHIDHGCPAFTDTSNYIQVSDHEIGLLGLKLCAICEKRKSGGPAIEALREILAGHVGNAEEAAWLVFDALKERGFYIASRRKKDGVSSPEGED